MTANDLCRACSFTLLCCGEREITGGVYCCDLLSMVMGRAPADGIWFTVMANQNTIVAAPRPGGTDCPGHGGAPQLPGGPLRG